MDKQWFGIGLAAWVSLSTNLPALAQTRPYLRPAASEVEEMDRLDDPANWIAPPTAPEVFSTPRLTPGEVRVMTQSLENLLGRVTSAALAAQATTQSPPNLNLRYATDQAQRVLNALKQGDTDVNLRWDWQAAQRALWDAYPRPAAALPGEMRAVWLDRGTIVRARSEAGLARVFDQLAAMGCTTVLFETVNAGFPIYPSRVAPAQNPQTRGWDPLAAAVKLAHERGMELHAWVWVFAAGNSRHNRIIGQPANYPGPVLARYPHWANLDRAGRSVPPRQDKPFLDPAHPGVRRYLLSLYEEIVTQYNVDGLHLDYIRYPFQNPSGGYSYGYGSASRMAFQQETGVDPLQLSPQDGPLWQQWLAFRTYQVSSFVVEVARQVRQARPNLTISAAVFPMQRHLRLYRIQQDWEAWAQAGAVDVIFLMSYAADTQGLQNRLRPAVKQDLPALLVPGVALEGAKPIQVLDQIQALRDSAAPGYALFATSQLRPALAAVLGQGSGTGDKAAVHRDALQVARARLQSLKREWTAVGQPRSAEWVAQVGAAERALETLIRQPSPEQVETARSRLLSLERSLDTAFPTQSDYQKQVWQQRLQALGKWVAYSQRPAADLSNLPPGGRPR